MYEINVCTRFTNWGKGEIFLSFAPNIYKHFISGHCININYYIYPAIISIHRRIKCEFDNNIMQLSFDYPFWYFMSTGSELIYYYFPISTGKDVKWVPVK
jgi:hypothetical protein